MKMAFLRKLSKIYKYLQKLSEIYSIKRCQHFDGRHQNQSSCNYCLLIGLRLKKYFFNRCQRVGGRHRTKILNFFSMFFGDGIYVADIGSYF